MKKYFIVILSLCVLLSSALSSESSKFVGRIIDGNIANGEHAFTVRILSAFSSASTSAYLSTGVAVTPNRVITVGQAIFGFGIWYIGHGSVYVAEHYESISIQATVHPDYDSWFLHNNIGVIRVPNAISITIPIIPPTSTGTVFGYGIFNSESHVSDTLRRTGLFTLSTHSICLPMFNEFVIRSDNICGFITQGFISNGDQGGPITNNAFTGVFGIVSFWNADGTFPILVNFNEHLAFITSQLS